MVKLKACRTKVEFPLNCRGYQVACGGYLDKPFIKCQLESAIALVFMATSPSLPQLLSHSVQDDDILWTEYLNLASVADARLVTGWTKIIDVLLVFVRDYSSTSPLSLSVVLSRLHSLAVS